MNKFILFFFIFISQFSGTALCADDYCASLLTDGQLNLYLRELFEGAVLSESDLTDLREALLRREQTFLLKNSELDIARLIATDKINSLLENSVDFESVIQTIEEILDRSTNLTEVRQEIDSKITGLAFLIRTADIREMSRIIQDIFAPKGSESNPSILRLAIVNTKSEFMGLYARHVFSAWHWKDHPELLRYAIDRADPNVLEKFATYVFSQKRWFDHPALMRFSMERVSASGLPYYAAHVLSLKLWESHHEFVRLLIDRSTYAQAQSYKSYLFSKAEYLGESIFREAIEIEDIQVRSAFMSEKFGPYPWEGTEQENLEEYLNKLYGRIDE